MGQPAAFFEILSPDHGRFAVFTDPDGGRVRLWS